MVVLFIKSNMDIDGLANKLKAVLNIPPENAEGSLHEQCRFGLNRGGQYYHFRVLAVDMELLKNEGEVGVPGHEAWPFYIWIYAENDTLDADGTQHLARHLARVLSSPDLQTLAAKV